MHKQKHEPQGLLDGRSADWPEALGKFEAHCRERRESWSNRWRRRWLTALEPTVPRDGVWWLAQALMETEVTALAGAG